jgi:tRNA(Ile)-lysidine synthetase-like protein
VVAGLGRRAALAADDDRYLEDRAIETAAKIVSSTVTSPDARLIDAAGLAALPPALARRVVRHVAASLRLPAWSERHVDDARRLASIDRGHLDLPGAAVDRRAGALAFTVRHGAARAAAPAGFAYELDVPGSVAIPEAGRLVTAVLGPAPFVTAETAPVSNMYAGTRLVVRSRQPGDRLRPLGAPGSRKLQDVLVDRKVPRAERDRVPLVVDASGRIVWVVGVALTEASRRPAPEAGVVTLISSPLVGER